MRHGRASAKRPVRPTQALQSVEERLDTKYGVVLLQPAYTSYQLNLGEISSYPPGYKENAGIFCHNNPWISCAETVLGHGDRAFAVYNKTCPAYIEDITEIHRTEPYVYSQMVAGSDAPTFGEAKNSWLTGTAAWTFFNVSQYILGIQPTLDGLRSTPASPTRCPASPSPAASAGPCTTSRWRTPPGCSTASRPLPWTARPSPATFCRWLPPVLR